jgi:hypothetical protein
MIAGQYIKNGIGHVAPVVGYGKDGKLYVANIGAFSRHGVVDITYAFADDMKNLKFWLVKK